jgi:hypothetical protein
MATGVDVVQNLGGDTPVTMAPPHVNPTAGGGCPLLFSGLVVSPTMLLALFGEALTSVSTTAGNYTVSGPTAITVTAVSYAPGDTFVRLTTSGTWSTGGAYTLAMIASSVTDAAGDTNTTLPEPIFDVAAGASSSGLTLPWAKANGLELAKIAAIVVEPKGDRRNIGDQAQAVDGTMRLTQQAKKRDLHFTSIPLTQADAFAWESLLTGEGHVWSFDVNLYSSKGLGPSSLTDAVIDVGSGSKFGTGALFISLTTGTITFTGALLNTFGARPGYTVMVWRYDDGTDATFHHYVVRSDGAKWKDGVRNDATATSWLTVSGANVTLVAGGAVDPVIYSDLVCLPFDVLDDWPTVFGVSTSAYCPTPYLDLVGKMVPEQTTRRVLGAVAESVMQSGSGARSKLDVTLQAK